MTRARSIAAERRLMVDELRREGAAWPVVATAIRERWGVNMRAAMRLAHGWSQSDAAAAWNQHWPDEPKTHKAFSAWELWPGPNGHAPPLAVLDRLAELYACAVPDLLADANGYGHLDHARTARAQVVEHLPRLLGAPIGDEHPATELIAWLNGLSFGELTERVSSATAHFGDPATRREILGKIAAALSLAAAEPALTAATAFADDSSRDQRGDPSGGIWLSTYRYFSDGRGGDFTGEHYVVLRRSGDRLAGRSVPSASGSVLDLDLTVGGPVITGAWTERTSPTGYYKGATYHGALQLVTNLTGRTMAGMWVGYSKTGKVNTGPWDLTWVDRASEVRKYRGQG